MRPEHQILLCPGVDRLPGTQDSSNGNEPHGGRPLVAARRDGNRRCQHALTPTIAFAWLSPHSVLITTPSTSAIAHGASATVGIFHSRRPLGRGRPASGGSLSHESAVAVDGSCAPELRAGPRRLRAELSERGEVGAAVAVWVDGDLVVNCGAGRPMRHEPRPWREDTVRVYRLQRVDEHLRASAGRSRRGRPDAPIARYWPEFAQAGKESITLAMVMAHRRA